MTADLIKRARALAKVQFSDTINPLCDLVEELQENIDNAHQAACETQRSWKHRCHAVLAALGLDFGDPDFEIPDELEVKTAASPEIKELVKRLREQVYPTVSGYDESDKVLEAADALQSQAARIKELEVDGDAQWNAAIEEAVAVANAAYDSYQDENCSPWNSACRKISRDIANLRVADAQWNAAIQSAIDFVSDWAIEPETPEYRIPLDIADALYSLKKGPAT